MAIYAPARLAQSFPTNTTEATVYTAPGGTRTIIKQIVVANVTAVAAEAHLSLVPSGGTVGDSNRFFKDLSVPGTGVLLFDLSQVMEAGDFISLKVDTASSIAFTISGVQQAVSTLPIDGLQVAENGALLSTRPLVNFIEGANIALTVADNPGASRADVTVAVSGNLGHTLKDEGTPLTTRAGLNFVGAGVVVTDNAGGNETVVTVGAGEFDPVGWMGGM
jgi:hypothetical protein